MKSCFRVPWVLLFFGVLIIALIFAYVFKWQTLLGILPWLLILACPLMHLMGGHGNNKHPSGKDQSHDPHHDRT